MSSARNLDVVEDLALRTVVDELQLGGGIVEQLALRGIVAEFQRDGIVQHLAFGTVVQELHLGDRVVHGLELRCQQGLERRRTRDHRGDALTEIAAAGDGAGGGAAAVGVDPDETPVAGAQDAGAGIAAKRVDVVVADEVAVDRGRRASLDALGLARRVPDDADHVGHGGIRGRDLRPTERGAGVAADPADRHVQRTEPILDQLQDREALLGAQIAGRIDLEVEVEPHVAGDFLRRDDVGGAVLAGPLPAPARLVEQVAAGEEQIVRDHGPAAPAHARYVAGVGVDRCEIGVPLHLTGSRLVRGHERGRHVERAIVLLDGLRIVGSPADRTPGSRRIRRDRSPPGRVSRARRGAGRTADRIAGPGRTGPRSPRRMGEGRSPEGTSCRPYAPPRSLRR